MQRQHSRKMRYGGVTDRCQAPTKATRRSIARTRHAHVHYVSYYSCCAEGYTRVALCCPHVAWCLSSVLWAKSRTQNTAPAMYVKIQKYSLRGLKCKDELVYKLLSKSLLYYRPHWRDLWTCHVWTCARSGSTAEI